MTLDSLYICFHQELFELTAIAFCEERTILNMKQKIEYLKIIQKEFEQDLESLEKKEANNGNA